MRSLVIFVACLTIVASTPATNASTADDETALRASLKARTIQYYDTLSRGAFSDLWEFSGSLMRRVNPQGEFASAVAQAISEIKLLQEPEVYEMTTTSQGKVPLGKARVRLVVAAKDGKKFDFVHSTVWIRERPIGTRDYNWFMVRDGMSDPGATPITAGY